MDNLTHSLAGVALSRSGFNRWNPRSTLVLLLACNAPDMDIVALAGGSATYLEYHRTYTHSFLLSPLIAVLVVLAAGVFRTPAGFRWGRAFVTALAGVWSHLLQDWTNTYGIRFFEPLDHGWYRLDSVFIVDVWLWAVLFLAIAAPFLSKLVSGEIGARPTRGQGWAVLALLFAAVYPAARLIPHDKVLHLLEGQLYEEEPPTYVAVLPGPVNPFEWRAFVETRDLFAVYEVRLWEPFNPVRGTTFYKPERSPAIEAAARDDIFQTFLAFSPHPLWQVIPLDPPSDGSVVQASDLRFGQPPDPRFVATAVVDKLNRVVGSDFRYQPAPLRQRVREMLGVTDVTSRYNGETLLFHAGNRTIPGRSAQRD